MNKMTEEFTTKKSIIEKLIPSPLMLVGIMTIILLTVVSVFRFGNPQWNRWIYIFQAYYFPKYKGGFIKPTDNFTGNFRAWYKNGDLYYSQFYLYGKRHGKWFVFYENNRKYLEIDFKNGLEHGSSKSWNEDGYITSFVQHLEGKKHGVYMSFYSNGNIKFKVNLLFGKITGKAYGYDKHGKLIKVRHHNKNGDLIKEEIID